MKRLVGQSDGDEPTSTYGAASKSALQTARRCWPIPRRYYVAIMAFLGFCNVYALRVNLSIAMLKMTANETVHLPNGTDVQILGDFHQWSSFTIGVVLGAFFYGYIFTQLPAGWLACRFGGKLLLGIGAAGSAVLTLLTPVCAYWGVGALIAVRVLQGLFQGVTYPSMHAIWGHWAPAQERTKLATISVSGSYFGTVIAMPLSAWLAETFGWPMIFYFLGAVTLIWSFFWFYTIAETPADDSRISNAELTYIQSSLGFTFESVKLLNDENELDHDRGDRRDSSGDEDNNAMASMTIVRKMRSTLRPPWKEILTSGAVWAIIASHFAENWGFYTMLTKMPAFMRDVLKYDIENTGFIGAVPYLAMGILVQVAGQFSDYLRTNRNWNTIIVRKIFNSAGLAVQCVFTLILAHVTVPGAAVFCLTMAVGFGGFVWSAFSVNQLDIAPQYASILMGISNTVATLPGMISPPLVGLMVKDGSPAGWQAVFYIAAAIYVIGALIYAVFAKAECQRWAEVAGGYVTNLDDIEHTSKPVHELD